MKLATREELIHSLKAADQRVTSWFEQIPAGAFFTRQGEEWSASENMDHLIRSHKPLVKALKLPKVGLQGLFGKSEGVSRSYETICQIYRDEIAKGAQASGRYLPDPQSSAANAEQKRAEILAEWSKVSEELVTAAEKWDEKDLDLYLLPHPLIGKLTIREMLFFTIYHNLRHATLEGD
ncbi:MAG: DinB family protein [Chloroflexota bacterium]